MSSQINNIFEDFKDLTEKLTGNDDISCNELKKRFYKFDSNLKKDIIFQETICCIQNIIKINKLIENKKKNDDWEILKHYLGLSYK